MRLEKPRACTHTALQLNVEVKHFCSLEECAEWFQLDSGNEFDVRCRTLAYVCYFVLPWRLPDLAAEAPDPSSRRGCPFHWCVAHTTETPEPGSQIPCILVTSAFEHALLTSLISSGAVGIAIQHLKAQRLSLDDATLLKCRPRTTVMIPALCDLVVLTKIKIATPAQ